MKFSLEIPPKDPLWRLQIYAHLADSLSFETIWLSDHYYNRSVVVTATSIAAVTRRARIGLGIMNPYLYHPVLMAQTAASLSEVAPGRVSLGVGAGDRTAVESLGLVQDKPVERVREAVLRVRSLLGGPVRGGGVGLDYPAWGRIPVYVAAQGPRMLRLAAEVGDGVIINSTWLLAPEKPIRIVEEALTALGRNRRDFSLEMNVLVSVHEDAEKARKTAKPYVAVVSMGLPSEIAREIGVGEEKLREIASMVRARMWLEAHRVVPDRLVEFVSIAGDPICVRSRIEDLANHRLDGLVFGGPLGPTPRKAIITLSSVVDELSGSGSGPSSSTHP